MSLRDYPLLLIALVLSAIVFGYQAYGFWFQPEKARQTFIEKTQQSPSWYPFRDRALKYAESNAWIWQNRLFSTLACGLAVFLLVAEFTS